MKAEGQPIRDGHLQKPELTANTLDNVRIMGEFLLEDNGAKQPEKAIFGPKILELADREFPDHGINSKTFGVYLSKWGKEPESRINTLGRRQGYYLISETHLEPEIKTVDDEPATQETTTRKEKERLLYPVMEAWILEQDFQANDTSSLRRGGIWGNPDLTGIKIIDSFYGIDVEVLTIETKVTHQNWEQFFFEAVAHRRFANKAYFAFSVPDEQTSKIPKNMRYYSELYQVGVLVISLEQDRFDSLLDGKLTKPINPEDADVLEVYSAPFCNVQRRYQFDYLESTLGIGSRRSLDRWGKAPEDSFD